MQLHSARPTQAHPTRIGSATRRTLRRAALGALAAVVASLAAMQAQAADVRVTHELRLAGMSHHFEPPRARDRSWNENHDGLGIQRSLRRDGRVLRYSAGYMRDSHGKQGLYAGLALSRHVQYHAHSLDLGVAPMLLWRTTRFDSARLGPAPHRLVPALLPVLAYEFVPAGIGAHLTAMPQVKIGQAEYPGMVFLQFTLKMR